MMTDTKERAKQNLCLGKWSAMEELLSNVVLSQYCNKYGGQDTAVPPVARMGTHIPTINTILILQYILYKEGKRGFGSDLFAEEHSTVCCAEAHVVSGLEAYLFVERRDLGGGGGASACVRLSSLKHDVSCVHFLELLNLDEEYSWSSK